MGQTYFHGTTLHHLEDVEVEYAVDSWGCGPTMASWNYPGDPGEPIELHIVAVCLNGEWVPVAQALTDEEHERIELEILNDPPEPPDVYDYDY